MHLKPQPFHVANHTCFSKKLFYIQFWASLLFSPGLLCAENFLAITICQQKKKKALGLKEIATFSEIGFPNAAGTMHLLFLKCAFVNEIFVEAIETSLSVLNDDVGKDLAVRVKSLTVSPMLCRVVCTAVFNNDKISVLALSSPWKKCGRGCRVGGVGEGGEVWVLNVGSRLGFAVCTSKTLSQLC